MSSLLDDVRDAKRLPSRAMAREIRLSAGLTQSDLAAEVGVHRVTLARWEAGEYVPRGRVRARYARLLRSLQQELAA